MPTYHFPAGTYYFGDPCYVIRDSWMDLLGSTDYLEDYSNTKWKTRAANTAHGDGVYYGMNIMSQFQFSVDAGVIGVVPLDEIEVPIDSIGTMGKLFTMDHPFQFEAIDGSFYINNQLVLETNSYEDEDDDYYDDQYDEEDEEEDY